MVKKRTTLSLDAEAYASYQKLVPNVSAKVDEFIRSELVRLGGQVPRDQEYEALKKEHSSLYLEILKRKEWLVKDKETFEKANEMLLQTLGLKKDLSNLDDVTPRFMHEWTRDDGYAQEFITTLELVQKEIQVRKRLLEMRTAKPDLEPSENTVQTVPLAELEDGKERTVGIPTVEKDHQMPSMENSTV